MANITNTMSKRDTTIDLAKAIGILLMILGHINGIHPLLRNFIFSFHMPLFFIFSGYFYKSKTIRELISNGLNQLVLPYLDTSFFCIVLCLTVGRFDIALSKIIGTFMSNGSWSTEMYFPNLPYIGPIWFFLALYWCKIFYECLKRKTDHSLLISFLISTIALLVGKYIINLPLGILTGLCGMIFNAMGDYWKNREKVSSNLSTICSDC